MAIKSSTLPAAYSNSRPDTAFIQGTIATCLLARSQERGVLRFIVRERGLETTRSKKIQKVFDHPNPLQSRVEFNEQCSQFHDATGNAIILFIEGSDKLPIEMWCLPSFFVEALFEKTEDVVPHAYRWADGRVIADNKDLCFIRRTSVKTAPYVGLGYLTDQQMEMYLYDAIIKSQLNFFRVGGAPNVALVQPKDSMLTTEQVADIQAMWNAKYNPVDGISNIAVLPDGVEPKNFGPQEINYNASKAEVRDSIREGFQTPKIILGDTDNVNHNNGQTALAMFERLVVLRYGQKKANALEHYLQKAYGDHFTVTIDPQVSAGFTMLPTPRGNVQMPDTDEFLTFDKPDDVTEAE